MEPNSSKSENEKVNLLEKTSLSNCRICLDIGINPLINPCNCNGTTKFVHEMCLKQWITTKYTDIYSAECEICRYKYRMEVTKKKKCDPKEALPKNFIYCFSIPICVFFVISMAVVTGFTIRDRLDVKNKKARSIVILSICLSLMGIGMIILAKAVYQVLVVFQVEEWSITPLGIDEGINFNPKT